MNSLRVMRTHPHARMPVRGTPGSAGLDLLCLTETHIWPYEKIKMPTGLHFEIPAGHVGLIRSRSSAFGRGLLCQGTIDSDYRGEVFVVCHNIGKRQVLGAGMSIAQIIIVPSPECQVFEVFDMQDTKRGSGGFGSTGRITCTCSTPNKIHQNFCELSL